jgi:hypothetical protein
MSCNNCNNCAQCTPALAIPLAPPPSCNTSACEEYISSDCVVSEIDGACQGEFTPLNGDPVVNVGYQFDQQSSLTAVLSALTNPANCTFSVPYIGAMLQFIQNDPTHVLQTIFCSIVADCVDGCGLDVVSTLSFDPVTVDTTGGGEDAYWTTNFYPHLSPSGSNAGKPDYTYIITITDTTASIPTVYQVTLTPAQQLLLLNPTTGLINFNFNNPAYALTEIQGPTLGKTQVVPSGHTYETVITSSFGGITCDSDSFTLVVPQSPLCPTCDYDLTLTPDPDGDQPVGCIYLDITSELNGLPVAPYGYHITVTNITTQQVVANGGDVYVITNGDNPYRFELCDLVGTDYRIVVESVCSFNPLYCTGSVATIDVTSNPPATCAPPDITSVTVNP